jgi:membrane fusion protein, copper/silver efflux system
MKAGVATMLAVLIGLIGVAGGYWWGARRPTAAAPETMTAPMARPGAGRKVLYYRNPMGLADTSPVPKKDPMGTDYLPVYEGEDQPDPSVVRITTDKIQRLGVRTEPVTARKLTRTVRAVGTVQADERRLHVVAPKFEGWIQRLHVNTTGQVVQSGEPLMDVYSPELVSAQQEYLIAWRGVQAVREGLPEIRASMQALADSALQRLRNWDISDEELGRLQSEGQSRQYLTLRAPGAGVVLEKSMVQGQRFMSGEMLYRIADLSVVWLLAQVFEQDIALVRTGQAARIKVDAYPEREFNGRITFVYPTVNADTRTAKVRIELSNHRALLKPDMYARAELLAPQGERDRLAVPDSAVLDTGIRQVVLVRRGEGTFEPRTVRTGARADGYSEIIDGLKAGEEVVVSANFLIDAESNLKAALGGFGTHAHGGKPETQPPARPNAPAARPSAPGDAHKGH